MNDLLNNTTKPKNIEELYKQILEIVTRLVTTQPLTSEKQTFASFFMQKLGE